MVANNILSLMGDSWIVVENKEGVIFYEGEANDLNLEADIVSIYPSSTICAIIIVVEE